MADKTISQLTASSTPLAGTEVLPIVQSSTTKQVSVANLTAGRAVAMKYLGVDTATGFALAASIGNSSGYKAVFLNNDPGSEIRVDVNGPASAPGNLLFFGGTFGEYGGWLGNGDYRVKAGNLIIGTAGKGIDFSANAHAAGMTSELLTWYEEGTWTPALTFGGAAVGLTGTFTGNYTRIGNTVTVWGNIVLTNKGSSTGSALITGLPFTASGTSSTSNVIDPITGMANLIAGGCIFSVVSGAAVYPMFQSATTRSQISEQYFTNSSQIAFSSTYKV